MATNLPPNIGSAGLPQLGPAMPIPGAALPNLPPPTQDTLAVFKPPNKDGKAIQRTLPDPPPARRALVKELQKQIGNDKTYWDKAYKRMREDISFARYGAKQSW